MSGFGAALHDAGKGFGVNLQERGICRCAPPTTITGFWAKRFGTSGMFRWRIGMAGSARYLSVPCSVRLGEPK